jgi:hypothetical protein
MIFDTLRTSEMDVAAGTVHTVDARELLLQTSAAVVLMLPCTVLPACHGV